MFIYGSPNLLNVFTTELTSSIYRHSTPDEAHFTVRAVLI